MLGAADEDEQCTADPGSCSNRDNAESVTSCSCLVCFCSHDETDRVSRYWKLHVNATRSSRMLKKPVSGVLISLRGSTFRSVRLASSVAAAWLDSLFEHPDWIIASVPAE